MSDNVRCVQCPIPSGQGGFSVCSGLLAQRLEPPAHNRVVLGSNPRRPICFFARDIRGLTMGKQ